MEPFARTTVRVATATDDPAVATLLVRAFTDQDARRDPPTATSPQRLAELRDAARRRRDATVLVAERDGAVVGTVCLLPPGAPGHEAWVANAANLRLLATDPSHQGRGVSATLLDASETLARGWGADAVCLHVHRSTPAVVALYLARGYERDPDGDLDFRPEVYLEAFLLRFAGNGNARELDAADRPG